MEKLEQVKGYQILSQKFLKEMNSTGVVLEHKKTGARVFAVMNDDENKVFSIGFRTPPTDSTGVAHILEHTVLCGSEKFPVKDPFVELVKGSLNTFLNAMTYPDKTVYPIASCNDKDFQNLMDVYMDAVFHPNILKEKKIFMQEGWHYELTEEDAPITYNGVVYNEMKGAFSSPESVLDRMISRTLFPDTCYGHESGGDPDDIPNLTYEAYLEFYHKYYHPSNSFIYLYGNMDMEEKLVWMDEQYLSQYDRKEIDSRIRMQQPFSKPVEKEYQYSVLEDEPLENASYLSVNTVVGTDLDPKLYVAFQILEYTLLDAPGAPLKEALLKAGIGSDIMGGYESGILQPYFSVVAKGAKSSQKEEFLNIVKGTLRKMAEEGMNRKSLLAGMNYFEFRYREEDYGSTPRGLMYGLQCMDSWLYDGDPMMHLEYQQTFDFLKKAVNEGYFESLIREYLLDNPFEAVIVVTPERNLTEKKDEAVAQALAAYKESLTPEQIRALIQQTKDLKEYQETPSPKEDLLKIPMLKREEIEKKAEKLYFGEKQIDGVTVVHHNLFTSGIGYLTVLFQTDRVPMQDLPYVGLLKSILGYVDTEHYTYGDFTSEIHLNSGGLTMGVDSYVNLREKGTFTGVFFARMRLLYDKIDFGMNMIEEVLLHSLLDDKKRLLELLSEVKSRIQMRINSSGHSMAVTRATSYFSPTSYFNDAIGGIAYYHFVENAVSNFETESDGIIAGLKRVIAQLFTRENIRISFTADEEGLHALEGSIRAFAEKFPEGRGTVYPFTFPKGNRNEGFKTASQVNYVARCGTFADSGFAYTGALRILKVIMNYDYLWIRLRVKGGAYGCMSGFGRSGEGYFVSYRDPNVSESNQVYEEVISYLETFDIDERDMTKYVIGTISDLDVPQLPSAKGQRGLSAYFSGVTEEMLQKERDEILGATVQDIRNLAGLVEAVLKTGSICVIGNAAQIEKDAKMFGEVKSLA
ncbi:MAG: insulinase family protein [bacterium]|nr:insulinase family protein [bacterium]